MQALGAAKAWAGAAASFYVRSPDAPSALQWVGMPRAPRRRRLDPALMATPSRSVSRAASRGIGLYTSYSVDSRRGP